jgi:CBS domain containing-hemolysin-like protein
VADQLVPWSKVEVVPAGSERSRMLDIIGASPHACFPAVDRVGKVVGVLRQIDLYAHAKKAPTDLLRPAIRLNPKQGAQAALMTMRTQGATLAIVEDENARPIGIVTARDLIAPLTGELAGL